MDMENCLCGTWIRRATQEGLFEVNYLVSIDKFHTEIHLIGNELKNEYLSNSGRVKKSNIDFLEASFHELEKRLNSPSQ